MIGIMPIGGTVGISGRRRNRSAWGGCERGRRLTEEGKVREENDGEWG